jgi:hypothetical protein
MEGHMVSRLSYAIDELSQLPSRGSPPDQVQAQNSRTSLMHRLCATAPAAAVVLSMSAFTIVTIVLIVTTVAQAVPSSEGGRWHSAAPWSRWNSSPEISIGDHSALYADFTPVDALAPTQGRVDTAYVTSWMSEQ